METPAHIIAQIGRKEDFVPTAEDLALGLQCFHMTYQEVVAECYDDAIDKATAAASAEAERNRPRDELSVDDLRAVFALLVSKTVSLCGSRETYRETEQTLRASQPVLRGCKKSSKNSVEKMKDAERHNVKVLSALTEIESVIAALKFEATVSLADGIRRREAAQGLPPEARGKGIVRQIGLAIHQSPTQAAKLLTTAQVLSQAMPHTFEALQHGQLSEFRAQIVVKESAGLDPADRKKVDQELFETPYGAKQQPILTYATRTIAKETRKIADGVNPEARARQAAKNCNDCIGVQFSHAPNTPGLAQIIVTLPIVQAVAIIDCLRQATEHAPHGQQGVTMVNLLADAIIGNPNYDRTGSTGFTSTDNLPGNYYTTDDPLTKPPRVFATTSLASDVLGFEYVDNTSGDNGFTAANKLSGARGIGSANPDGVRDFETATKVASSTDGPHEKPFPSVEARLEEGGIGGYSADRPSRNQQSGLSKPRATANVSRGTLPGSMPGSGTVPITVNLVLSDAVLFGLSDEPVEVLGHTGRGYGHISAVNARELIANGIDAQNVWLRKIYVNPAGQLVALTSQQRFFTGGLAHAIHLRDHGTCSTPWCGAPARHLDHITPHSQGGKTELANGTALCAKCNLAKEAVGWAFDP